MSQNETMCHADDPGTSFEAAAAISKCLTKLHNLVMEAFRSNGPMTDSELEMLPQFVRYGPSTIRKRRSELFQGGELINSGNKRRNDRGFDMIVWRSA